MKPMSIRNYDDGSKLLGSPESAVLDDDCHIDPCRIDRTILTCLLRFIWQYGSKVTKELVSSSI